MTATPRAKTMMATSFSESMIYGGPWSFGKGYHKLGDCPFPPRPWRQMSGLIALQKLKNLIPLKKPEMQGAKFSRNEA